MSQMFEDITPVEEKQLWDEIKKNPIPDCHVDDIEELEPYAELILKEIARKANK